MSRVILDLTTYKTYPNYNTEYTDDQIQLILTSQNEFILDWLKFPDTETFEDKFVSITPLKKAVFDLTNLNLESTDNQSIESQSLEGNSVKFKSFEQRQSMILSKVAQYKAHYTVDTIL